jgi:hypothetical protein
MDKQATAHRFSAVHEALLRPHIARINSASGMHPSQLQQQSPAQYHREAGSGSVPEFKTLRPVMHLLRMQVSVMDRVLPSGQG